MNEEKMKHLDFLQSNIARMNTCSFQMKGWAIAIVSALLAIYAGTIDSTSRGNAAFIFVAMVPTVLFWFLDSYYLCTERKMRDIYNDVLDPGKNIKAFTMPLHNYKGGKYSMFSAMFSITEAPLYLSMLIGLLAGGFIVKA